MDILRTGRKAAARGLLVAAIVAAGGCSTELTGGAQGSVQTEATSGGGAAQSRSPAPDRGARYSVALRDASGALRGTVTFTARVSLVAEGGDSAVVVPASAAHSISLDGDTLVIGQAQVTARRYTSVRIAFTDVQADVQAGVMVGGAPLTGTVRVDVGPTGTLVVEAPTALMVDGGSAHRVILDVNAAQWLGAAVGGVVPGAIFRGAVRVVVR